MRSNAKVLPETQRLSELGNPGFYISIHVIMRYRIVRTDRVTSLGAPGRPHEIDKTRRVGQNRWRQGYAGQLEGAADTPGTYNLRGARHPKARKLTPESA
jgi:hypothetical protein